MSLFPLRDTCVYDFIIPGCPFAKENYSEFYQRLALGLSFSFFFGGGWGSSPVSFTNKIDWQNVTEIFWKIVFNIDNNHIF